MKGMKYHDYIWDLGGTLLDNYETSTAAFVETLAEFGIEQEHDSVYEALKVFDCLCYRKVCSRYWKAFLKNIRKMKPESWNIQFCLMGFLLF